MKKYISIIIIALTLSSCEFLDPTDVENPNVTDQVYVDNPNAFAPWLNGMRRQMAFVLNQSVVLGELTSDNYFNNRTLSNKVFDIPQIEFIDVDVNNLQTPLQILREMAEFGINEVAPKDQNSTSEGLAEMIFLRGMAYLMMGELFVGLPASSEGVVVPSDQLIDLAITDFQLATSTATNPARQIVFELAQARAYHHIGDKAQARALAQRVIDNGSLILENVEYDGLSGVRNDMQFFLFDSERDEFAPLPRLDFLDPKYFTVSNASVEQKPVALLKAEEAYFILAEALLSDGQLNDAKNTLQTLLSDVIAQRPIETFDDSREDRDGGNRNDYPLTADYSVKSSPEAAAIDALVLDRQAGQVSIATVSGTRVTAADIDAANNVDELLELLYLMRQEVFFAEGRRVIDLGIKFPVSQIELLNNPNIETGNSFLNPQIPTFIPGNSEMDDFVNDPINLIITIDVDMNKVLIDNKASEFVVPFF